MADGGRNGALDRLLSSRHDAEGRAADDGAAELAEGRAADDGHDGVRGVARHISWRGVAKLAPRSAAQHMAGAMTKRAADGTAGTALGCQQRVRRNACVETRNEMILLSNKM
jgi:hypothetical protein